MARPRGIPKYRKHKKSGQAIVTLTDPFGGRQDVLLGAFGTNESRAEYARVLGEWEVAGRTLARSAAASGVTVNELILLYWQHVEEYYRHPDGRPTSEQSNIKQALRPLKALYGGTIAAEFDSLALEAIRNRMVQDERCRTAINRDFARIKRLFKWAASKKLVPVPVHQSLLTIEGLRAGRSGAKESAPVKPVPLPFVDAILPHVRPPVAAMIQLQLHTGMRPGEVVVMRAIDIDMTSKVWLYRPGAHKTAWRGHERVVPIGPRGQEVLRAWLRLNVEEFLFQPRETRAQQNQQRRGSRETPLYPCHLRAQEKKRKQNPKRRPAERYSVTSYNRAIGRGVESANRGRACEVCKDVGPLQRCEACQAGAIPHWHAHQLRHSAATTIRREAGLDAARAVLGHRSPAITEVYAELDMGKAAEIMARLG